MTEQQAEQTGTETGAGEQEQQTEQTTFTQADVDKIVADRLKRERDKIGDVKVLQAAAKELEQIKEANKTEAQKNADRLAVAEQAAADATREALKFKIAAKFQIGDADADLFLTGSDEETVTKQAERLAGRESERKKKGNYVPREGNHPKAPGTDDMREFTRSLFAKGD